MKRVENMFFSGLKNNFGFKLHVKSKSEIAKQLMNSIQSRLCDLRKYIPRVKLKIAANPNKMVNS
ncbi:hypothetical protein, partial [Pseudoalteromonas sp.]|uniref:hypothetical protein n=1 Tax=Pseudoalteromonas sp. TaxID=53249 RepID=UPI003D11FEE1